MGLGELHGAAEGGGVEGVGARTADGGLADLGAAGDGGVGEAGVEVFAVGGDEGAPSTVWPTMVWRWKSRQRAGLILSPYSPLRVEARTGPRPGMWSWQSMPPP